jgi:hypothetical protein
MNTETPTPAAELKRLIDADRLNDAMLLCQQRQQHDTGNAFYAYWLERLRADPAPRGDAVRPPAPTPLSLHEAWRAHPYRLTPAVPLSGDFADARAKLVARLPFKSEIYLPTSKVAEADQIIGLQRVADLVSPPNLEATRLRFELLREHLQARGCKRVFVIGNGPSLKRTDLALLRDEVTIGFNGIFLHESFTPTIYVVEDHLVAEDRHQEIAAYRCPVKIFPSYLGYCIEPQDNTIFLNHLGRISFPVDTDFSADAGRITYTGGTVTYTGLQIAASLGAEEIILVGVDASYQVGNVERSQAYGTGVLTSTADDTNHFDPRYFGKGYRWHDPNVHTMLQAYRKARDHGRRTGVRFVNATLGGQLEVFPRVDYHALFPAECSHPRVAVIDFTSTRRLSATGVIKRNLLDGWPKNALLHVHADDPARLSAFQSVANDQYAGGADQGNPWAALRALVEFDPQVLYLRPTLDRMPMTLLQVVASQLLGRPWILHYMDDWLEKLPLVRSAAVAAAYRRLMEHLFLNAETVLAISTKMATLLVERHQVAPERVQVVHNFVQPAAQPRHEARAPGAHRVVRYFGGLERDMGLDTVREFARQIESFNRRQPACQVTFEIYTTRHALQRHQHEFAGLNHTRLLPQIEDPADYAIHLAESDLNLLCYNFDQVSLDYVRYSLANKLPDLIASGAPFLAIGHPEVATIEVLVDAAYPLVLTEPDWRCDRALEAAFAPDFASTPAYQGALSALAEEFSEVNHRSRFHRALRSAVYAERTPREAGAPCHAAMHALLQADAAGSDAFKDLDALVALTALPPSLTQPMLVRVRDHGLSWSIRNEAGALRQALKSPQALSDASSELQSRAVAFLVASHGHERFSDLNDAVRAWLRSHLSPATV